MNRIITIFYTHKARYGYRRMTLALWNEGIHVNHKLVQRLMNKMGLLGVTPKAKYKSYKGDMNGTVKNLLLDKVVDETYPNQIKRPDPLPSKNSSLKIYLTFVQNLGLSTCGPFSYASGFNKCSLSKI